MAIPAAVAPLIRRRVGFRQVIRVGVALDAEVVRQLLDEFWHAVQDGAREIWVDVSGVATLGSLGRHALERMHVAAHELGRDLVVIANDGEIAGMLELTTFPDLSAAHYRR